MALRAATEQLSVAQTDLDVYIVHVTIANVYEPVGHCLRDVLKLFYASFLCQKSQEGTANLTANKNNLLLGITYHCIFPVA